MKLVMFDYGHGGKDSGATANDLKEKDLVLQIGKKTKQILDKNGAKVMQTRNSDTFVELSKRAELANSNKADIFVSFHVNDASSKSAQGVEVYAYPNSKEGKSLANNILASIVEDKVYNKNRGVKTENFSVLRRTSMPAALVELGFIGNKEDAHILVNRQDELAKAIAKGVLKYFGLTYREESQNKEDEYKKAVDVLVKAKIIGSPDTWYVVKDNNTKSLIIKTAAYINQKQTL